jgi:hypothetical protein
VDPVPDPLLLKMSGSAENQNRTSGSVARNSEHYTTEALPETIIFYSNFKWGLTCGSGTQSDTTYK